VFGRRPGLARGLEAASIMNDDAYMDLAIAKGREGIAAGQMPVGALLVRDGSIVCATHNTVWRDGDPTAHGEMNAVRHAATALGTVDLTGSTVYVTLEPCPMCLGAMHWARIGRVVYGASIADSASFGFSELAIPAVELARLGRSPLHVVAGPRRAECLALFEEWRRSGQARTY
jgi:tRNA(Arg) A34 adenosine deaminase TadA